MIVQRKSDTKYEAFFFDGSTTAVGVVKDWARTGRLRTPQVSTQDCHNTVQVRAADNYFMTLQPGHWLVRPEGSLEFYRFTDEEFKQKFEKAADQ